MTVSKTQINQVLKDHGYSSIKSESPMRNYREVCRKYEDGSIIKGIVVAQTSPMDCFSKADQVTQEFNNLVKSLNNIGLFAEEAHGSGFSRMLTFKVGKKEMVLLVRSIKTYLGQYMDPGYKTHFIAVNWN